MSNQYILGQYVRIIGRPELLTIGAIRDGLLFIGDRWWPAWMATGAACAGETGSGGAAVNDDQREAYEERAGILEFCAGMTRRKA